MKRATFIIFFIAFIYNCNVYAYSFSQATSNGQMLYYKIIGNTNTVKVVAPQSHSILNPTNDWGNYTQPSGTINIPSTVTTNSFKGGTYTVVAIDDYAFYDCDNITKIYLPSSVTSIGNSAFFSCSNLIQVHCGGTTNIGNAAFSFSGIKTIYMPSVTTIGNMAFKRCDSLISINIPNTVTNIGAETFDGCHNLENVHLPLGLTEIPYCMFNFCTRLDSIVWPAQLTTIGVSAFASCGRFKSINVPSTVINIAPYAFYRVKHIEYHGTATGAPWGALSMNGVTEEDFVYSDSSKTKLLMYIGSGESVSIPATVDTIGDMAFYQCNNLKSIIFPSSLLYVGPYAFVYCDSLQFINSLAITAPSMDSTAFDTSQNNISVVVPCGSISSYTTTWTCFSNFYEEGTYILNISTSDSTLGTVEMLTIPTCSNPTAIIQATPTCGYYFQYWSDGDTDNPRTITLTQDTSVIAYFGMITDTIILHDTMYIDVYVHDTAYVDVYVHDTTTVIDTVTLMEYVYVHDTTLVPVHDTTYINVHDTTYITLTDTVSNIVYDTITDTIFDTITNTVYDTIVVFNTDTLWLHDTVFVYDTIYIHDTIVVGVGDVETVDAKIYINNRQIVVEGADGNDVWLYDVNGRILAIKQDYGMPIRFDAPDSGTYMIKIGNYPARKVVVIR